MAQDDKETLHDIAVTSKKRPVKYEDAKAGEQMADGLPKAHTGRPRRVFTEKEVEQIGKLARTLNQQQLADFFNIPLSTLKEMFARDERVSGLYKNGKSTVIDEVAKSLIQQALEGNTAAQIFFLKTQARWKEVQEIDHTSSDGSAPMRIEVVGVPAKGDKSHDDE